MTNDPLPPLPDTDPASDRGPDGRFLRGRSGNPAGRAKGQVCFAALLKKKLRENGREMSERIATALLEGAAGGSIAHIREVLDRVDGPVAARVVIEAELERILDIASLVLVRDQYAALLDAVVRYGDKLPPAAEGSEAARQLAQDAHAAKLAKPGRHEDC